MEDMRLDSKDRASLLALPTAEFLQHNDDIHCPLPEDKDDGNPAYRAPYGAEAVGIAFQSHKSWVLLPHVEATCLDWAQPASTARSNAACLARSTRGSRR